MRHSRLRAPALATVLALALVLTGCGSGTGVEAGLRPLVLSAVQASTEDAGTAKTSFVVRMEMSGIPDEPDQSFELRAEGALDITNKRARFVVEVPEGMEDEMPFTGPLDMIVDGDTAYVRLPEGEAPPGRPWLRMPASTGFDGGTSFGLGGLGSAFDPNLGLDLLGFGEPSSVETVGRADVRGTSTIHYRVTATPNEESADGRNVFLQMFSNGQPFVYDVWVDDDDRLRKVTFSVDLAAMLRAMFDAFAGMAAEMGGEMGGEEAQEEFPADMSMLIESEMEVWDFGVAVDIVIPPADQVTDHSVFDL